jgi:hypothetical protein
MLIQVDCKCGKDLNIPEHLAGKRVKCPGCGDAIEVPIQITEEYVSPPFYKGSVFQSCLWVLFLLMMLLGFFANILSGC